MVFCMCFARVCRDAHLPRGPAERRWKDCSDDHALWICWNQACFHSFHPSCPWALRLSGSWSMWSAAWSSILVVTRRNSFLLVIPHTHSTHTPNTSSKRRVVRKDSSDDHTLWIRVKMGVLSFLSPAVIPVLCRLCLVRGRWASPLLAVTRCMKLILLHTLLLPPPLHPARVHSPVHLCTCARRKDTASTRRSASSQQPLKVRALQCFAVPCRRHHCCVTARPVCGGASVHNLALAQCCIG
jgi:hypothetical protein